MPNNKVNPNDIVGQRFGRLTVEKFSHQGENYSKFYDCICDCGGKKTILRQSLTNRKTQSCGCLHREFLATGDARRTHGMRHTREYLCWADMVKRCTNPNSSGYKKYGDKGIKVCQEWIDSFEAFFKEIGPCESDDLTIDRYPNKYGNYEPGNVRWATDAQQRRNKTDSRVLKIDGIEMCLCDWLEKYQVNRYIFFKMIKDGEIKVESDTGVIRRPKKKTES